MSTKQNQREFPMIEELGGQKIVLREISAAEDLSCMRIASEQSHNTKGIIDESLYTRIYYCETIQRALVSIDGQAKADNIQAMSFSKDQMDCLIQCYLNGFGTFNDSIGDEAKEKKIEKMIKGNPIG